MKSTDCGIFTGLKRRLVICGSYINATTTSSNKLVATTKLSFHFENKIGFEGHIFFF